MTKPISELERWSGGYPGEHAMSDFANLERVEDTESVFEAADRLIDNWQGNKFVGVYMYGPPGNGKTHGAVALGRALHDSGAEIMYTYAPGLVGHNSLARPDAWMASRTQPDSTKHSLNTTFPAVYSDEAGANRKQVLILDDYKPEAQKVVNAAIEAAAHYGGLVIVTSNHPDPLRLTETHEEIKTPDTLALEGVASQFNPDGYTENLQQQAQRREEVAASLRSRVAAGFRYIEFTGPDRRLEQNFWD